MEIGPGEVRRLARLARLSISEDEISALPGELARVLHHLRVLGELPPLSGPAPAAAPPQAGATRRPTPATPTLQDIARLPASWDAPYVLAPPNPALSGEDPE